MLIHIIIEKQGRIARFERRFKDGTPDQKILSQLGGAKVQFGYQKTIVKEDKQFTRAMGRPVHATFDDPKSGYAYDHANTVVCEVDPDGNELRRLKGPPPPVRPEMSEGEPIPPEFTDEDEAAMSSQ